MTTIRQRSLRSLALKTFTVLAWLATIWLMYLASVKPLEAQQAPPAFADHPARYEPPAFFRGVLYYVVDGDTYDVQLDLGFDVSRWLRIRLEGVNTPELRGAERLDGIASKAWVQDLIGDGHVRVRTDQGRDRYGRWVAAVDVWLEPGRWVDLGDTIVAAGHGAVWQ